MVASARSSSDSTRDVIAGCHSRLDRLSFFESDEDNRSYSTEKCHGGIEHEVTGFNTRIPGRFGRAGITDQPCPWQTIFGSVPVEQRLSLGRLTKLPAARPEILRIGARRMCGMGKQPDCEDAQCHTG